MKSMKELLKSDGIIVAPGCFDPLSALALEKIGFTAAYLGGWAVGAHLGVTEPLTTLTEITDITRHIAHVTNIPLTVDAGAGFGHLPMIRRCVRAFEQAGAQAIHIEDQVVPKRINYHKGRLDLVSVDEMLQKLDLALKSRSSDDLVIIARTDAGRNKEESFDRAIERANIYAKTGVDMIKTFPRNEEEMIRAPKEINAPLCYVASEGLGRPIPTPDEAKSLGYKMIVYPLTPVISAFGSIKKTYEHMFATGKSGFTPEETSKLSKEIMSLISIDQLAEMENGIRQ
ncbi:isocitrate lyase/PEP mutase family protein [Synergistaceae bacterium OttesenSCG-928-I11]|nr:isocitrate lyase/PEP mutase family protein [Synergistaceae bacterium OttesenSCG-928-I11]